MTASATSPIRRARIAVTAAFIANGLAVASFITRIPDIRATLDLREAVLGGLLSVLAVGVVIGLVAAGRAVPRAGSRRVTLVGAVCMAGALPFVGLAPSAWTLGTSLFLLGLGGAVMDVGMNAQGVGVERQLGRSIMLGLHGGWSIGTLVAALLGAGAIAARVPVSLHLGVMAGLIAALALFASRHLRVDDRVVSGEPATIAWPRGALLPLGLVAFAGALGEAAASDWSGIFLTDVVVVPTAQVGWGFVAYTAAMTTSRLLGDLAVRRFGAQLVLRVGGVLAGLGFLLAALVPVLPVTLVGFVLVGLGLGGTVPLAFAAAGRVASSPGAGVAAVASVGYLAFIVGPTSIGLIAEATDLRLAFGVVATIVVLLIAPPKPGMSGPDDPAS
ncbi:MAG: MFS transporter [Nitriliruptoraceae bacterium]|nr:MFS transporter [Nitriliruptoraceae bacterium]